MYFHSQERQEPEVAANRIAILHEGQLVQVVQVGTPEEIYNRPGNKMAGLLARAGDLDRGLSYAVGAEEP